MHEVPEEEYLSRNGLNGNEFASGCLLIRSVKAARWTAAPTRIPGLEGSTGWGALGSLCRLSAGLGLRQHRNKADWLLVESLCVAPEPRDPHPETGLAEGAGSGSLRDSGLSSSRALSARWFPEGLPGGLGSLETPCTPACRPPSGFCHSYNKVRLPCPAAPLGCRLPHGTASLGPAPFTSVLCFVCL